MVCLSRIRKKLRGFTVPLLSIEQSETSKDAISVRLRSIYVALEILASSSSDFIESSQEDAKEEHCSSMIWLKGF